MSNRTRYPSQSSGAGRVYMEFELKGAGASALTLSTDAAAVVSGVSRSGVGVYVVTLKDAFNKCLYKSADMDDTLNDGAYATVSDLANEATATPMTFTIRTRNSGCTATDAASGRR